MNNSSTEATVEFKAEAMLGEGPLWDEAEKRLYWVDILSGKLFRYDPYEKTNDEFVLGEHLGAIALRKNGGLVFAMKSGFAFFDPDTGNLDKITDPEEHLSNNRFNDGKCDPTGRFWAGTMSYDLDEGEGNLYCLNTHQNVELKLEDLTIANGMAWNQNKDKFYFIDTSHRKIYAFDYDDSTGSISNKSVLREIDPTDGYPDGMTIDDDGHLFVALYDGGKIMRIEPTSGKTVYEIHLPVPKVTCCAFGGNDLNELYITTARQEMSRQELKQSPLSGSLFKAELPFSGKAAVRFSG